MLRVPWSEAVDLSVVSMIVVGDSARITVTFSKGDSVEFTVSGTAIRALAKALPGPEPGPADVKIVK